MAVYSTGTLLRYKQIVWYSTGSTTTIVPRYVILYYRYIISFKLIVAITNDMDHGHKDSIISERR